MLRALGMGDDDWGRSRRSASPPVWNTITPCNMSLRGVRVGGAGACTLRGGFPMEFGTITVSDVISMGHEGMHFSLVSREVIADSVETVMQAERIDGMVTLAGCDKSIPAMLMAAARIDVASVLMYAGSLLPGHVRLSDGSEQTVNIVDGLRGSRRQCPRADVRRGPRHDRAARLPERRNVWRHVHGEHDGERSRGDGHVAARLDRAAGRGPPP